MSFKKTASDHVENVNMKCLCSKGPQRVVMVFVKEIDNEKNRSYARILLRLRLQEVTMSYKF